MCQLGVVCVKDLICRFCLALFPSLVVDTETSIKIFLIHILLIVLIMWVQ